MENLKRFVDKYVFGFLILSLCVITISVLSLCVWLFGEYGLVITFIIMGMGLISPIFCNSNCNFK